MDLSRLKSVLASEPSFRLKQVEEAIFKNLITNWDEAKNLPASLREKLKEKCPLEINAVLKVSKDNSTAKALIILKDGAKIETVLMKHNPKDTHSFAGLDEDKSARNSICVSTQVGCPMGCAFCATGTLGLTRSLTQDEIIEQILFFARHLKKTEEKITNITFMGMGEPFLNYDAVISAIRRLNDKNTLNLGARRFSISTCGIIEGIDRLADENLEVNLALSLHAPNDKLRTKIMPANRKYPLAKILESIKHYYDKTHRKLMFEYIMLKGVNDSEENAEELAQILKGFNCMVNLIPYNLTYAKESAKEVREKQKAQKIETKAIPLFDQTSHNQIRRFKNILEKHGIDAIQRFEFGQDIDAACGQLAAKS
ncbi:MAG TPA: 23S rRNA (adenine(2503)-C(2))-methyltransferase RlmN [Candidatus Gracilibacteria bacterium]|nr:23S rRNA (adenine(2503)-C(2))-methyltransferase RlmN [Candidatus Gracilibacteria bacterium]